MDAAIGNEIEVHSDEPAPMSKRERERAAELAVEGPSRELPTIDVRDILLTDISEIENVRSDSHYNDLDALASSIHTKTQMVPALVRPAPLKNRHGKAYELVTGYRRKRATEQLGLPTLRCQVREVPNREILDMMLTENMQRQDLSPIEEARAMRAMIDFGKMQQTEVAKALGCTKFKVSHRLKLLDLEAPVRGLIEAGELSASHGEALAALPAGQQEQMAQWAANSGVGVKKLQGKVREAVQHTEQEQAQGLLEAPQALQPTLETVPVAPMQRAKLPEELSETQLMRATIHILLRNGRDQEMLDWIAAEAGFEYDALYDWVRELPEEDLKTMWHRLVKRYYQSAVRLPILEQSLLDDLDAVIETVPNPFEGELPEDETEDETEDEDEDEDEDEALSAPAAESDWRAEAQDVEPVDDWGDE